MDQKHFMDWEKLCTMWFPKYSSKKWKVDMNGDPAKIGDMASFRYFLHK